MTMTTHDDGNARMGDPASSHRTVKSIVKDNSLAALILDYATRRAMATCHGEFNDTQLWQALEAQTGRRFQRNVLARARGRLVKDGLLVHVGPRTWMSEDLEHYTAVTTDE